MQEGNVIIVLGASRRGSLGLRVYEPPRGVLVKKQEFVWIFSSQFVGKLVSS